MISPAKKTSYGVSISTLNKADIGKIGIAGPLVNVILACIFGIIAVLTNLQIAAISAQINIWLGLFNLIPIGILDGYKIWQWSKGIWATMLFTCLGIFFLTALV
jgi:Zn-dependent protease